MRLGQKARSEGHHPSRSGRERYKGRVVERGPGAFHPAGRAVRCKSKAFYPFRKRKGKVVHPILKQQELVAGPEPFSQAPRWGRQAQGQQKER